MKQLLLSLMMLATLSVAAKDDDGKYLAGAVPEENGIVTFKKSFSVPGKSTEEINNTLHLFVNELVSTSIPAPGNYARVMADEGNTIVARVCEWMEFKRKPLNLDRARFRYQITAKAEGNHIDLTITNITYYYGEDADGEKGVIYKAEEWISDKEALNKAQTKLYPKSGKFRRKTVDRAEEIFDAVMDAFEEKEEKAVPIKKVRKGVVED